MDQLEFKHWKLEKTEDGIVKLYLDVHSANTNTLSQAVIQELDCILDTLQQQKPTGLAICSAKKNGFIAGADVNEFKEINSEEQALVVIQKGQSVFEKLDRLPFSTAAIINGYCMGGGLELALACDYRIALDEPNTRFSLPEIRLGIHPGYGGTVRILRIVNPLKAMDLMLTGRSIDTYQAKKMGLIDHAVPERRIENALRQTLLTQPPKKELAQFEKLLNNKWARGVIGKQMRKRVANEANPKHYPAPYALIDHWVKYADNEKQMFEHEALSVAKLSTTTTAKNLVRVFFLQNTLKSLGGETNYKANHVHVIGAGVMGGDIAAWCALQGLSVTIQDIQATSLARAKARAYEFISQRVKNKVLANSAMDRFIPDQKGLGTAKADVIIEAIFENADAKRNLYKKIEPTAKPNAIIATNTSSIEIDELSKGLKAKTRLVGLHFFNPIPKMQLVEIVVGSKTQKQVIENAISFTKQIGKLPLPTKSLPGFLVNRILTPYMLEAAILSEEGCSNESIDKAAKDFGMPMGPLELADTLGLDVALHVAEILSKAYGFTIPHVLPEKVRKGELGKKSGKGFYTWTKNKPVKEKLDSQSNKLQDIEDRLVMRFLNETVACRREQVVESSDLLDVGVIFGTGFAPFLGGPMHYIETIGSQPFMDKLDNLKNQHGERFTADSGWEKL